MAGGRRSQQHSSFRPFVSLSHGIQADRAAVVNGLILPWSTGPVEGTVTKVKLLKRQGYGRAATRRLRRRAAQPDAHRRAGAARAPSVSRSLDLRMSPLDNIELKGDRAIVGRADRVGEA